MAAERHHPHGHRHPEPGGAAVLRERGRRLTPQRRLIWEALVAEPDAHVSVEEVVRRVRGELPQVNPSTVYRTLELLVEEGLVLRTDLGADRTFYELAHDHVHHHLVCERCGAVAHVHDDVLEELRSRAQAASGYLLRPQEVTLLGLCSRCQR